MQLLLITNNPDVATRFATLGIAGLAIQSHSIMSALKKFTDKNSPFAACAIDLDSADATGQAHAGAFIAEYLNRKADQRQPLLLVTNHPERVDAWLTEPGVHHLDISVGSRLLQLRLQGLLGLEDSAGYQRRSA